MVVAISSLVVLYLSAKAAIDSVVQRSALLGVHEVNETMASATWPLQIAIFAVFSILCIGSLVISFWPSRIRKCGNVSDCNLSGDTGMYLSSVINFSNDAYAIEDDSGRFVTVNRSFPEMLGISEAMILGETGSFLVEKLKESAEDIGGLEHFSRTAGEMASSLEEIVLTDPVHRVLLGNVTPILDDEKSPVGRVWKFSDITKARQLEDGLCQSQKMESVGQLAVGVAHDFNNLLTGINGNLAIVEMELESRRLDLPERKNLRFAIQAGLRAGELVKQLLGFSRADGDRKNVFAANEIVKEVKGIMTASIDPSISVETEFEENLWTVNGDPNMVSQCLINMATNARDALSDGGWIWLGTANCKVTAEQAGKMKNARVGEFVRLTVEDNGEGMPQEVVEKIFTPFFTTKERGKGTGLGLATSLEIINRLGGWVTVESKKAKGTRFDIYLPRGDKGEIASSTKENFQMKGPGEGQSETILIVDDEDVVRNVASSLLKRLGYHILTASNGLEALEVFEEHRDSIDLVMLDLTMPKLSGQDTFSRLRAEFDFVPVLICSGYLLDLTAFKKETGDCPEGFVQKPYRIDAMASSVREVLDKAAAA